MSVLLNAVKQHKQLISMTPLIDVVFILLLFFMLSSTFNRMKQIEVRSVSSSTSAQILMSEVKRLVLHNDKTVSVDGSVYRLESQTFRKQLSKFAENNDKLIISATHLVSVQALIALVDLARKMQVTNIKLSESVSS